MGQSRLIAERQWPTANGQRVAARVRHAVAACGVLWLAAWFPARLVAQIEPFRITSWTGASGAMASVTFQFSLPIVPPGRTGRAPAGVALHPAVQGRFDAPDSVSLRFTPGAPWLANTDYRFDFDSVQFRSKSGAPLSGMRSPTLRLDFFPTSIWLEGPDGPLTLQFRLPIAAADIESGRAPAGVHLRPDVPGKWVAVDSMRYQFRPGEPFRPDQRYLLQIDTAFRGRYGVKLNRPVEQALRLTLQVASYQMPRGRQDTLRLWLGGSQPRLRGTVVPPGAISISPPVAGRFEVADSTSIRFVSATGFAANTEYTVTVDTSFRDSRGLHLDRPWSLTFSRILAAPSYWVRPVGSTEPFELRFGDSITPLPGGRDGAPRGVTISPPLAVRFEVREAKKLLLYPVRPLEHGLTYRVTIDSGFTAAEEPGLQAPAVSEFVSGMQAGSSMGVYAPSGELWISFGRSSVRDTSEHTLPSGITISPEMPGRVNWTGCCLTFAPAGAWRPGVEYTFAIDTSFRATDGTRMVKPFEMRFRGPSPAVLAVWPLQGREAAPLTEATVLRLLLNGVVDPDSLARQVRLRVKVATAEDPCHATDRVAFHALGIRRLTLEDSSVKSSGWHSSATGSGREDLLRIVELRPASALPPGCQGILTVGEEVPGQRGPLSAPFRSVGRLAARFTIRGRPSPDTLAIDDLGTGYFGLEFSQPVNRTTLVRHLTIAPAAPLRLQSYRPAVPSSWEVTGTLLPGRRYRIRLAPGLTDAFGGRLADTVEWIVATPPARPAVRLRPVNEVRPIAGPRTIAVRAIGRSDVELCTLLIPDSLGFLGVQPAWWALGDLDTTVFRRRSCVPRTAIAPRNDTVTVELGLPAPEPPPHGGITLVWVEPLPRDTTPGFYHPRSLPLALQWSDLVVQAQFWEFGTAVLVTDRRRGSPRKGALVREVDCLGRIRAEATTDARGRARLTLTNSPALEECRYGGGRRIRVDWQGDRLWLTGDADPGEAVLGAYRGVTRTRAALADPAPAIGYVGSDRPVYPPGDTLHAVVVSRRERMGVLDAAAGDSIEWVLIDGRDFRRDPIAASPSGDPVLLSRYGMAAFSIPLPASLPPGPYRLLVRSRQSDVWSPIAFRDLRVERYRTEALLATIDVSDTLLIAGDTLIATVEGRWSDNRPAAGRPVRWAARFVRAPFDRMTAGVPESWINTSGMHNALPADTSMLAGTGVLTAEGRLDIPIALPPGGSAWPYQVTITSVVQDGAHDSLELGTSAIVRESRYLLGWRRSDPGGEVAPAVAESVQVFAMASDRRLLPNVSIEARLAAIEWAPAELDGVDQGWRLTQGAPCVARTGSDGRAICVLSPVTHDNAIQLSAPMENGWSSTTLAEFAADPNVRGPPPARLVLATDRSGYSVGDTLRVRFTAPFPGTVWLCLARQGLLHDTLVTVRAGSLEIAVPLPGWAEPELELSVVLTGRGIGDIPPPILRGVSLVTVSAPGRRLRVEARVIEGDRVAVTVRGADGHPVDAEVLLWGADARLAAYGSAATREIGQAFSESRGKGLGTAHSGLRAAAEAFIEVDPGSRIWMDEYDDGWSLEHPYADAAPRFRKFPIAASPGSGTARISPVATFVQARGSDVVTLPLPSGRPWRVGVIAAAADGRVGAAELVVP